MSLAEQLLDAQVAWLRTQLTGPALADRAAEAVDDLLEVTAGIPLAELVDPAEVARVGRRLVSGVPSSEAATRLVGATAELVYDGPSTPFTPGDVLDRDHVEALVTELLGATRLASETLDELATSPLAATVASRFVSRLVGEVLASNRAVAEKIPGVGGLVSFGSSAASRVRGAADRPLDALVGGISGSRGAAFAAKRLNKVILDTLADPTTRDAVMEVWDMHAGRAVPRPADHVDRDKVLRFAGVLHTLVAHAAASDPVGQLVEELVGVFFAAYGTSSVAEVLDDLGITRDELVADAQVFAAQALERVDREGRLEPLLRARLAPFFALPEVRDLLG